MSQEPEKTREGKMGDAAEEVIRLREEVEKHSSNERRLEEALKEVMEAAGCGPDAAVEGIALKVRETVENAKRYRARAKETLLESRIRELATEHGVVDAEAARKLVDLSGVKVDVEKGVVEGLEEAMEKMLKEKTYLVARPRGAGGTPGGGTPRGGRAAGAEDETLAGRVRKEFAKRLPGGMGTPGGGTGGMRIR